MSFNPAPLTIKMEELKTIENVEKDVKEYVQDSNRKNDEDIDETDLVYHWIQEALDDKRTDRFVVKEDLDVEVGEDGLSVSNALSQTEKERKQKEYLQKDALRLIEQRSASQKAEAERQLRLLQSQSPKKEKSVKQAEGSNKEAEGQEAEITEESAYNTDYDLPQFSPFHLSPDEIKSHRKPEIPKEEVEEEKPLIVPVPVIAPKKKVVTAYRPKMDNSKKVLNFVDKQVRKELFLAIKNGNITLLNNFVSQFGKSMTSRSGQINYQSESTGNTILHLALLLDYEKKQIPIDLELEENNEPKTIKQAFNKESAKSMEVKFEVVKILVQQAGSDPCIRNRYGLSAIEVAQSLKDQKIYKFITEQQKPADQHAQESDNPIAMVANKFSMLTGALNTSVAQRNE